MAPEQWRGEAVSIQTDIYAMGLVLYYALTSRLPYEGESLVALMYKHLHEPLLEQGGTYALPDYLVEVIRRATEKAPEQRFESAEEFAVALPGGTG
jgi:serine/threonine-protein kinase